MTNNWKTTLSGIGAAFMAMLGGIAALPYELGDVATIIPPEWKARVTVASFIAAFVLRVINSTMQADAKSKPASSDPMQLPPVISKP